MTGAIPVLGIEKNQKSVGEDLSAALFVLQHLRLRRQ
jgi:hypothetical protein